MFGFKKRRRARLRRKPLTQEQRRLLAERVGWIERLPAAAQRELDGLIQIFLAEKNFEGCGGLVLSDEMRLVIAAQACILLLGRDVDEVYPDLHSILVYPDAFVAPVNTNHGGIVTENHSARIGEAWSRGSLTLAWNHVRRDANDVRDGHNVVFHEFAHALDFQDGAADGAPLLGSASHYRAWARVLGETYSELREHVDRHRPTSVIDEYAATNPAEFFAVATESFFEKGRQLERAYPELYEELRRFYRRDPAALERGEPEQLDD